MVHVDPSLREFRRRQKVFDLVFHAFGPVRIIGLHRDAVERVAQTIKFLSDVNRYE